MSASTTHPLIVGLKRDLNFARTQPSNNAEMVEHAIRAVYKRYTGRFGDEIEAGRLELQDAVDCYHECSEYDGVDPGGVFEYFKARHNKGPGNGGAPPVGEPVEPAPPPPPALPTTKTAAEWADRALTPRRYIGVNFLPFREVSILNGHGGAGKTQLALQIAIATVLGTDCFGFAIKEKGPV